MAFLDALIDTILPYLDAGGGLAIAVAMALESMGLPLSAEVILPFLGFLVWQGRITIPEALLYGVGGQMIGSTLAYLIARSRGRDVIWKHRRYLLLKESHLATADRWFERHGKRAVFVARLLPVVRGVISYPAGFTRMEFTPFLIYSFMGILPFTVALIYAGFELGDNWAEVRAWLHRVDYDLAVAAIIAALTYGAYLYFRFRHRKRKAPPLIPPGPPTRGGR